MERNRVVICGGSGTLGQPLAASLVREGREVVIVSRSPDRYAGPGRAIAWEGLAAECDGAAAVVNLAGKSVACRWSVRNRKEIIASRVRSVTRVADAIKACDRPPAVWVQASAIGVYGDRGDEVLEDDAQPPTSGSRAWNFLAGVCTSWESAARACRPAQVRQVILCIGVVLQPDAGAWPTLERLAKLGLGGRAGEGRQFVPWIDSRDMMRLFRFVLDSPLEGTVNAVGPNPVRNEELMAHARRRVGRRLGLRAPAGALRLGQALIGVPAEPALASCRAVPKRLLDFGFEFQHSELGDNVPAQCG